jgi:hypothetical protein
MTALFFLIAIIVYVAIGWVLYANRQWVKPLPIVGTTIGGIDNNVVRTIIGILTALIVALIIAVGGATLTVTGKLLIHPIGILAYAAVGYLLYTTPAEKLKFLGFLNTVPNAIAAPDTVSNRIARVLIGLAALLLVGYILAMFSPAITKIGKVLLTPITVPFGL